MKFQDKYISTLEEILSLRQELQSNSQKVIMIEEKISLKILEVAELERKLNVSTDAPDTLTRVQTHAQETVYQPPPIKLRRVIATPLQEQRKEQRRQSAECKQNHVQKQHYEQENTPKYRKENKRKKAKTSSTKMTKKKPIEQTQKIPMKKPQEVEKSEKELPPIEIDPTKYVEWSSELQESLICWNEIIKSTHPGSLSHMGFSDKFRIEQAIHDFLSTRLHWRDIQYCVAISRKNIPLIAIPEDWADDFSDWFSERIEAGLLDSKVKYKRRSAKMQPVLGIKHGDEYQEFPDSMALVYPEFRSWLEIVRIRFPAFVVGFIHEEFVRDYLLSRDIVFKVMDAEFEQDNAWGIPSESEEQFFNAFLAMFHYQMNGRKVFPKTHWQIPKCKSIEYFNNDKPKSCGSSVVDVNENETSKDDQSTVQQLQIQSELEPSRGIFGSNQVQSYLRPFRKAVVSGSELFHWRDIVEDKFGSDYDDLLNKPHNQLLIQNCIRQFLNGSLLPAGLEPKDCFVCFSDDSDSEEEDLDETRDYGIPSILKDEFELWFSIQADYGFRTFNLEKNDEEDEFEDDQLKSQ